MTFLNKIKAEIMESLPKKSCCRRTLLLGILASRGEAVGETQIRLSLANADVAALASRLIKEQFGRQADSIPMHHGGRLHVLSFESRTAVRFLSELSGRFLTNPLPKQCSECASSFLGGLFLACGRITDPSKAYHLEFSLGERARPFIRFLADEYGYAPSVSARRGEVLLYFKDSTAIEDIMTMLGINDAAFLFMNCKIEKQFRNEANRRTNCEAGNIHRSVEAASRIIVVLRKMEEERLLSSLSEELECVARLRLDYPEASLTQLSALSTPALTKSGIHHRLQKIMEFAKRQGIDIPEE